MDDNFHLLRSPWDWKPFQSWYFLEWVLSNIQKNLIHESPNIFSHFLPFFKIPFLDSFEGTYLHTYLLTCTTCSFFMIDISPGTHAAACTHIFFFFLLWRNRQKMLLFLMFLSFTMGRDHFLNLHQMQKQKITQIFTNFHEIFNQSDHFEKKNKKHLLLMEIHFLLAYPAKRHRILYLFCP